jgi:hypothetical protein
MALTAVMDSSRAAPWCRQFAEAPAFSNVNAYRPKARRPSTDIDDSLKLRNTGNDKIDCVVQVWCAKKFNNDFNA